MAPVPDLAVEQRVAYLAVVAAGVAAMLRQVIRYDRAFLADAKIEIGELRAEITTLRHDLHDAQDRATALTDQVYALRRTITELCEQTGAPHPLGGDSHA